ncbi:unnamed protein product [Rhizopus microsporus]|uniref:Zinc/iron permease n=1 Tax=Rhizopus microsporus TaxID=58291 RepID=A0A1X0RSM1_RHIZD|nr:hypothetical protein BCV71DRAFT_228992 [Rhizopus microsporus]
MYEGWLFVSMSCLSCILGASIVFIGEKILENKRFLSGSMALGAGALFCNVQFNLLPTAYQKIGLLPVVGWFLIGVLSSICTNQLIHYCTPHALHTCDLPVKNYGTIDEESLEHSDKENYYLIGIQTAAAICIHKFPEGLIMFVSNESSGQLGLRVAVAMMIHNAIEGLLIALPLYYAVGSQLAAFGYAAVLGGLSLPIGALIGYIAVTGVDKAREDALFGILFSLISGMMYMVVFKVIVN